MELTKNEVSNDITEKSIEEFFSGFDGVYKPVEMNWGEPVGEEVW